MKKDYVTPEALAKMISQRWNRHVGVRSIYRAIQNNHIAATNEQGPFDRRPTYHISKEEATRVVALYEPHVYTQEKLPFEEEQKGN